MGEECQIAWQKAIAKMPNMHYIVNKCPILKLLFYFITIIQAAENSTKPSYQDEALPNELNKCSRSDSIVDSPIVAATVGRKHLTDLKDPVTIKLKQLSTVSIV